jgi:Phosphoglycerate kinase
MAVASPEQASTRRPGSPALDNPPAPGERQALRESLPIIEWLRKKEAKGILMSHLGRADGSRVPDMSLRPVADALSALLGAPVAFADDCVGPYSEKAVVAPAASASSCSRTSAFTRRRRRTIRRSPSCSRRWRTST